MSCLRTGRENSDVFGTERDSGPALCCERPREASKWGHRSSSQSTDIREEREMVRAESANTPYVTSFTNGQHRASADNTPDKGGQGAGFRPHELEFVDWESDYPKRNLLCKRAIAIGYVDLRIE